MSSYIKSLSKPIAVIGLGKSGDAAIRLLKLNGIKEEEILTFDSKSPADFNDGDKLIQVGQPGTLVVSPGVPLLTPWIQFAKSIGCTITSEINLASSVLSSEKIIGITGSIGKSTTVATLGFAAKSEDENCFVGGNLGTPFATYAADVLEGRRRAKWVILELSSYQLENCELLKCEYSAITYLTPNHMERYSNLEQYYSTKWKIVSLTKQKVFLNFHGGDLLTWTKHKESNTAIIYTSPSDSNLIEYNFKNSKLIGRHNQENIALGAQIAIAAGWRKDSILTLNEFGGLEHRLENVGVLNGVLYINDSKATAIDSVITAFNAAKETTSGTIFLLLGGRDKNLPWSDLNDTLSTQKQTKVVLFGECRDIIKEKTNIQFAGSFDSLKKTIEWVQSQLQTGDCVLLSPGGTSLDEFKSFEDRGNKFKEWIRQ